jgi:hypothetical protein
MNLLNSSKLAACLAIIFVAGGAAGAVITLRNTRERQAQVPSMEKTCTRLQDRLTSKLGLSPDQVKTLQPIFDHTAHELQAVHARALRDTDQILVRAHEKIAVQLSPEQKKKLDRVDQERQEWLARRFKEQSTPAEAP